MSALRECPPPHPNPSRPKLALPAGACDAHCHVFGPASKFPYSERRSYTPEDAPKEKLRALHDLLGIERVVYVQASCHGFDNSAMVDALVADRVNTRGVAQLAPGTDEAEIARLNEAGVRGARLNFMARLGAVPDLDAANEMIARIAKFDWHLVVHFDPENVPELFDWLAGLPVQVAIDHMGRMSPSDIGTANYAQFLKLVEKDNIWTKISGAERSTEAGPPFADVLPIAQKIVEIAPDRALWGTDWPHPVLTKAMPDDGQLVDLLAEMVPDAAVRDAILVDNPARLYGF